MRKAVIGAAAGALLATAAFGSTAYAANHTVSVGGSTSAGAHKFFAQSKDAGITFGVRNNSNVDIAMSCGDVNVEGEVFSGTYDTDTNPLATIKAVTRTNTPETFSHSQWKDCSGPLGLAMTVVPLNDWDINADGTGISGGTSDTVGGYISGPAGADLRAHVYATSGGPTGTGCNFKVTGNALGSFSESTQQLTVAETFTSGNLSVEAGSVLGNCFGLIQAGNVARFGGTFQLGPDVTGNTKDTPKANWTNFPVYVS